MEEWRGRDPYVISHKSNAEGSRYSFIVDIKTPPPLEQWSLIAGDCVHNLRSALDSALYATAIHDSGVNPPPDAGRLQFPICDTEAAFDKEKSRRKLSNLSVKAQVWIERAQPYNRTYKDSPSLLRILREFDNTDKHRLLNVTLLAVSNGKVKFIPPLGNIIPTLNCRTTSVQSGKEFMSLTLSSPKRELKFEFDGSFAVCVRHSPWPSGQGVSSLHDLLASLITEVRGLINDAI